MESSTLRDVNTVVRRPCVRVLLHRPPKRIVLPRGWQWCDDWKVDVSPAKAGKDGWVYGCVLCLPAVPVVVLPSCTHTPGAAPEVRL